MAYQGGFRPRLPPRRSKQTHRQATDPTGTYHGTKKQQKWSAFRRHPGIFRRSEFVTRLSLDLYGNIGEAYAFTIHEANWENSFLTLCRKKLWFH